MLYFILLLIVAILAICLGARYHVQVNAKMSRIFGKGEELPPDFLLWLANHKGEYETIGQAMAAWADARYGVKYDQMLK